MYKKEEMSGKVGDGVPAGGKLMERVRLGTLLIPPETHQVML